jgi:hypothetical protein
MGDKNMISGIKKCIENKDIVGLRYIFLDSLDVDPTFEQYQSDYNVCKNIEGMFEPYIELTPLSLSSSDWNMEYWGKVKFDQKKNFSEKRFEHMRTIAKEVHAEKVKRLMAEREEKKVKFEKEFESVIPTTELNKQQIKNDTLYSQAKISEADQRRLEERKKELALRYQAFEKEQKSSNSNKIYDFEKQEVYDVTQKGQNHIKKIMGVALIIIIVIVLFLIKGR